MAIQQISPGQIRSVVGNDSMGTDVIKIIDKARSYHKPVASPEELPVTGNLDGDTRLALSDNKFYIWDEPTKSWYRDLDKSTEARTKALIVDFNNKSIFNTDLIVGKPGGIANIETITLFVNGMAQDRNSDYTLSITSNGGTCLTLEWISTDFSLDTDDTVCVNYDLLVME